MPIRKELDSRSASGSGADLDPELPMLRIAIGMLSLLLIACGDATIIYGFTAGTVAGEPVCDGEDPRFDLRDQQGLVLIVRIGDSTNIVAANGARAGCDDLDPQQRVQVTGAREQSTILAQTIQIL